MVGIVGQRRHHGCHLLPHQRLDGCMRGNEGEHPIQRALDHRAHLGIVLEMVEHGIDKAW